MTNPLLRRLERQEKQSVAYHRSSKQEKAIAKKVKGYRISGSGRGKVKGDVRIKGVLRVEAKTTQHKSFSVTLEMLEKITAAAVGADEVPAIEVEFLDGNGKPVGSVAVVPSWALEAIARANADDT